MSASQKAILQTARVDEIVLRFPAPVFLIALAVFILLRDDRPLTFHLGPNEAVKSIALTFLALLAVELFAQARHRSLPMRIALSLSVGTAVFLLSYLYDRFIDEQLLFLASLPVIALSAYAFGSERNPEFWQFNYRLWLGAALALACAILIGGGTSLIVLTLNILFGNVLPDIAYQTIWKIACALVFPFSWLSFIQRDPEDHVDEGLPTEFISRAAVLLASYILVPLLFVYTAVLYAYGLKIAIDGELPKGQIATMVLCYGVVGFIAMLILYPARNIGFLERTFWRLWPLVAIPPLILFAIAVYERIAQYGVTPQRYLTVLAGIWLAVTTLIYSLPNMGRDLRLAPALLAVLLIAASFGPWGMTQTSVSSQAVQLEKLLTELGRIQIGRFVPGAPFSGAEKERLRSIVRFLHGNDRLHDPFALYGDLALLKELGIGQYRNNRNKQRMTFSASIDGPAVIGLKSYETGIGPVQIINDGISITRDVNGLGPVALSLDEKGMLNVAAAGESLRIDIQGAIAAESAARNVENANLQAPIYVTAKGRELEGRVALTHIFATVSEPRSIHNATFWLYLGRTP